MQQPDAQSNVDPDLVYLALTRDELAAVITGLRAIVVETLAMRLEIEMDLVDDVELPDELDNAGLVARESV